MATRLSDVSMGKAASQVACAHSYRVWTRVLSSTIGDGAIMRRWDDSPATPGGSPTTEDGVVMEKALHNASQVQAHIG